MGRHRQRRDGTVSRGGTGTCVPTYMGRGREPGRGTGCECEVHVCGNDSAGVQCPVDRRWHLAGYPAYSPQHRIYILALQLSRCGGLHAVVHRDSSRGIHARLLHGDVCSQCTQGSHQFDHGWGKAFNRRFLSLMYQGEPAYMFDTTEHGSQSAQDPCQLDANSRALQLYQWVHLMYCLDTAVHNLHQLPVCINIMYQQRFTNCNSSQLSVLVFQGSSAVVSSAVMSMAANVAEVAVLMAATLSLIC